MKNVKGVELWPTEPISMLCFTELLWSAFAKGLRKNFLCISTLNARRITIKFPNLEKNLDFVRNIFFIMTRRFNSNAN